MGGKPIQLSGLGSSAGGASGASAVLAAASSAGGSSSATPAVSAVTLAGASPPGAAGASGAGAGGPRIVYVRKPTPTSVLNSSATGPTPTVMTTTAAAAGSPTKAGSKIIFVSNKNQLPGGSPGTRPVAPAGVVKLVSSGSPNAAGGNALPPGLLSSLRPVAVGSSAGAGGGPANAKLKGAPGAPLLLRTVMPKPVTGANAVFQPKAAGGSPAAAAAAASTSSGGSGGASVPQLPSVPIPKNKLNSAAAAVAGADSGKGSKAPPTSTAVATANNSAPAVDPKMQAMLPKRPIPISQKVAVGGSPPKIIKKVISNSQAGGAPTLIMPAAPVGQPGPPANALPLPAGK